MRVVEEVGSAHRDPALLVSGERNLSYAVPSGFRAPVGYKQTHDSDDGVDGQLEHAHVPSVCIAAQVESAAGMAVAYIEWVECNYVRGAHAHGNAHVQLEEVTRGLMNRRTVHWCQNKFEI